MEFMTRLHVAFSVLLFFSLAARAQARDGLSCRLDGVIDRWVNEERIVGVVALVARDGELVYHRAAGFADREAHKPVREDTLFRLASMTKAIVSATALALVDRGKLSLHDPVDEWLPYFTPRLADGRQPRLTIRQLMTHTSGLGYDFLDPEGSPYRLHGIGNGLHQPGLSLEDVLRRLASLPLAFEPGTAWRYSMSTDVLGGVIEQAAAMPLPAAVARFVTEPLDMDDTAFVVVDEDRLATPYRDGKGAAVRMDPELDTIPMGPGVPFSADQVFDARTYPSGGAGMVGTASDYLAFLEAIRTGGGPILGGSSASAFSQHAIGELRAWMEGDGWGFSVGSAAVLVDPEAAQTPQSRGTWQWGGVLGSHWFVDPVEKLTVVVVTNTAVAGVIGPFPEAIRDAIYGGT
jgi:CubicO group peptidase (beta-lactamase class C family)